jgi:hypothetical protein
MPLGSSFGFRFYIDIAILCSNSFWPLPANFTYTETVLSGAIVPIDGVIVQWPIFNELSGSPFPPFPAFFTSFFTYLAYFLLPFLSVAPPGAGRAFANSNLLYFYFLIFSSNYFLNYSLA